MSFVKNNSSWDLRFLELAKHIGTWSKDPSTQVGAVIVDEDKRIVSCGYNGFPKGMDDRRERYEEREFKYTHIVHAERNALLFAKQDLSGCIIYTSPFLPCTVCAGMIIQAGIKKVVSPIFMPDRWKDDFTKTMNLFYECGVEYCLYTT